MLVSSLQHMICQSLSGLNHSSNELLECSSVDTATGRGGRRHERDVCIYLLLVLSNKSRHVVCVRMPYLAQIEACGVCTGFLLSKHRCMSGVHGGPTYVLSKHRCPNAAKDVGWKHVGVCTGTSPRLEACGSVSIFANGNIGAGFGPMRMLEPTSNT